MRKNMSLSLPDNGSFAHIENDTKSMDIAEHRLSSGIPKAPPSSPENQFSDSTWPILDLYSSDSNKSYSVKPSSMGATNPLQCAFIGQNWFDHTDSQVNDIGSTSSSFSWRSHPSKSEYSPLSSFATPHSKDTNQPFTFSANKISMSDQSGKSNAENTYSRGLSAGRKRSYTCSDIASQHEGSSDNKRVCSERVTKVNFKKQYSSPSDFNFVDQQQNRQTDPEHFVLDMDTDT